MSTELMRSEGVAVEVFRAWTPTALRAQIAQERELRLIIVEYYQSCMVEGHHYYRLDDDDKKKPALSKEGALNLCNLFKVRPDPDPPFETRTPDGHYTVRYRTRLISLETGELKAIGDGLCSTREDKYAYRYAARVCPDCGKSAIIKGREEYGGGWLCFKKKEGCGAKFRDGDPVIELQITGRIPNEDLADAENTVLKMSEKRSLVDGTLKLPLASELFIQDLEEQIIQRQEVEGRQTSPREELSQQTTKPANPTTGEQTKPNQAPQPKPTAEEISQLLEFLRGVYQDAAVVDSKIRAALEIPAGQAYEPVRIRLQMTRARYTQLQDDATAYALSQQPPDDDVPMTDGPDASTVAEVDTQARGEGTDGSDASTTLLEDASAGTEQPEQTVSTEEELDGFPAVDVDDQGFVTQAGVELLVNRADGHGQKALLRKIRGDAAGWGIGQYQYAWVQVGKTAATAEQRR